MLGFPLAPSRALLLHLALHTFKSSTNASHWLLSDVGYLKKAFSWLVCCRQVAEFLICQFFQLAVLQKMHSFADVGVR